MENINYKEELLELREQYNKAETLQDQIVILEHTAEIAYEMPLDELDDFIRKYCR